MYSASKTTSIRVRLFFLVLGSALAIISITGFGFFLNYKIDGFADIYSKKIVPEVVAVAAAYQSLVKLEKIQFDKYHPESKEQAEVIEKLESLRDELKGNIEDLSGYFRATDGELTRLSAASLIELDNLVANTKNLGSRDFTNKYSIPSVYKLLEEYDSRKTEERENSITLVYQFSNRSKIYILALGSVMIILLVTFGILISTRLTRILNGISTDLSDASSVVLDTSDKILKSSREMSDITKEQATALEETSRSLAEINSRAAFNSERADQSKNIIENLDVKTKNLSLIVNELQSAMDGLNSANDEILKSLNRTNLIAEKTEIIDEIVFKTQLLSFNASVEAERAGEHGRGFAVVAQEVGSLAHISGNAAKEISEILRESIRFSDAVAKNQFAQVKRVGQLINEMTKQTDAFREDFKNITRINESITTSSHEQDQAISEINNALESVNLITQDVAEKSLQSADASAGLKYESQRLSSLVSGLEGLVNK